MTERSRAGPRPRRRRPPPSTDEAPRQPSPWPTSPPRSPRPSPPRRPPKRQRPSRPSPRSSRAWPPTSRPSRPRRPPRSSSWSTPPTPTMRTPSPPSRLPPRSSRPLPRSRPSRSRRRRGDRRDVEQVAADEAAPRPSPRSPRPRWRQRMPPSSRRRSPTRLRLPRPRRRRPRPPATSDPEPTTMEELLAEQDSDIKSFKHGDVVEGTVVRIDKDEILVDIGAKSEGVVSNRELYGRHAESQPALAIGDTVLVYVLQPESQEGHVVLSLRRAGLERKWRSMQEQFEAGVIIEAPVIDHNKGGLIVDCGIRGFVPISQIVDFPRRPQNDQPRDAAQEIAEKLQPFVGRKLRLKILEVNRKANRLILSEKVALYEERREKRDELFSSLQVGQKVTGTVRSIAPFGVFVDLGGIDGLVHKSELSLEQGQQPRGRLQGRRRGRGRGHRHQPRARPDQPLDPPPPARPVALDGGRLQGRRHHRRHRHQARQLRRIRPRPRRPRGPHPHQRAVPPAGRPSGRRRPRGPDAQAQDHLARLRAASPGAQPQAGRGAAGPAGAEPDRRNPAAGAPRAERRPRPERGYSMADAVQEPEGGIDNTLASAFAQVRQQLAEAEVDEVAETVAETEAVEEAAAAEIVEEIAEAVVEAEAVEEAAAAEVIEPRSPRRSPPTRPRSRRRPLPRSSSSVDAADANERRTPRPRPRPAVEVIEAVAEAEAVEPRPRPPRRSPRSSRPWRLTRPSARGRGRRGRRARSPKRSPPTRPEPSTSRGRRGRSSRVADETIGERTPRRLTRRACPDQRTTRRSPAGRFEFGPLHPDSVRRQIRSPDGPCQRSGRSGLRGRAAVLAWLQGGHGAAQKRNRRSTRWTASTSSRTAPARS